MLPPYVLRLYDCHLWQTYARLSLITQRTGIRMINDCNACQLQVHMQKSCLCVCTQATLAADDEEAQPSGRDFDDTASEASSAVSGMSAYQGSTTTGTSSVTGSSSRPASTVGGKKPHKRKQKKVSWH